MRATLSRRVYWDACTFLGLINQERGRIDQCSAIWDEAAKGKTIIYTSTFTFAEVFRAKCEGPAKPLSDADDAKIEQLLQQDFVRLALVDEAIGTATRRLMRRFVECKKPSDGIHLATALQLNVDEMHTFDGADLLHLDGKVLRSDGKPLRICPPEPLPPDAPAADKGSSIDAGMDDLFDPNRDVTSSTEASPDARPA